VSSFWLTGSPLLLQLSSYLREAGLQVGAHERLKERIAKHSERWRSWQVSINPDAAVDQATAEFTDDNGCLWVHSYLVWPHLAIYATISGPNDLARDLDSWAFAALRSLQVTLQ